MGRIRPIAFFAITCYTSEKKIVKYYRKVSVVSVIKFVCSEEQKQDIIKGVWNIVKEHYFSAATPNNTIKYEYEGEDIYLERLDALMQSELCAIAADDDGFSFTFDSTEDAGMAIAENVYGTSMGYCDNGLTFVNPIFEAITKRYKDIPFEAHCECYDSWVSVECDFSYDGKTLKIDDVDYEKYLEFMKKMDEIGFDADVEALAEEVGLTAEQAYAFLG